MNTLDNFLKTIEENVKIMGKEEILNENLTYGGPKAKIDIAISTDTDQRTERGMIKDPYFKVYNNKNPYGKGGEKSKKKTATKVARVYFDRPAYGKDHKGMPSFRLNSSQRSNLMTALNSPAPGYNNYWDKLKHDAIAKYNGTTELSDEFKEEFLNLPLPNFNSLPDK